MTKEDIVEEVRGKKKFNVLYTNGALREHITSHITFNEEEMFDNTGWGMRTPYERVSKIVTHEIDYYQESVSFGSDPELFILKDGKVVPSIFVVDEDDEQVTRDGFQIELHPASSGCRQSAASYIARCVQQAKDYANGINGNLTFDVGVTIDEETWAKSPLSLRRFGCNPTVNAHKDSKRRVTGLRERFRAGGGHIHIGLPNKLKDRKTYPELVTLMDIFAGNTMVILDRDEANITRRKNYGRAGEYREKAYGIEYRVLSNFWLRHYVLWSMASGLVRNAVALQSKGMAQELIDRVDIAKLRRAINENDKELAVETFDILCEFIKEKNLYSGSGLSFHNVQAVSDWLKSSNPISVFACHTEDQIVPSWENYLHTGGDGFEMFIQKRN